MNPLAEFDASFVAAVAVALGIVVAIVTIGVQLLTSTRAATTHLAKGNALSAATSAPPASGTPVSQPAASAAFDGARSHDAPSRQRFAAQLNEYYAANISQGNAIFWASLLSMSVGFAIIFVGILTAGKNSANAIVAGIAGVLSQFIGATFLVALRSTQAQSTAYAQTLVELELRDAQAAADARSIALGLTLVNEIAGNGATNLANQTRATIATGLIMKGGVSISSPQPVGTIPIEPLDSAHITTKTPARARVDSVKLDEVDALDPRGVVPP